MDVDRVNNCNIVKILGVTECNNCSDSFLCWGEESVLPEQSNTEESLERLKEILFKKGEENGLG